MEEIKEYLLKDFCLLKQVVRDINCCDGCFNDIYYEDNDESFFNSYFWNEPYKVAERIYYSGKDYDFFDDYVNWDNTGNLVSLNEEDYKELLHNHIDEISEKVLDKRYDVYTYDEEFNKLIEMWRK